MKLKFKLAAALLAGAIAFGTGNVCAFAENPPAAQEDDSPDLGAGAFNSGYSASKIDIKKDTNFTLTAYTYIPITNFSDGVSLADFDTSSIFGLAMTNDSFDALTPYSWDVDFAIVGSFLRVETQFIDVVYLGTGRTFSYNICYTSGGTSVNVQVSCLVTA